MKKNDIIEKVIVSESQIETTLNKIATEINSDYKGEAVVFVAILNGAFMFASDLMKKIELDCYIDFMQCSTYGNKTVSSGNFVVKKDITIDVNGKHVIIVEDILDSGYTMKNLLKYLKLKNPKTIKIATFIDKPARRVEDVHADYTGFVMDDDSFIVGYGLDYSQKYRNLPFIGVLKKEVYSQ